MIFTLTTFAVLDMNGDDGCTTMRLYLMPLKCNVKIIKMVNFLLCIFYHNKQIVFN